MRIEPKVVRYVSGTALTKLGDYGGYSGSGSLWSRLLLRKNISLSFNRSHREWIGHLCLCSTTGANFKRRWPLSSGVAVAVHLSGTVAASISLDRFVHVWMSITHVIIATLEALPSKVWQNVV